MIGIGPILKSKVNSYVLWCAFLVLTSFFSCKPKKDYAHQRPNIILIYSDELQFKDMGYFGGDFQTPRIDSLAHQAVVFNHVYSPSSMCTPSRYALLTGQFPGRCKHKYFLEANPYNEPYSIVWNTYLDSSTLTLPKLLSANGYTTGMSGKWHLGPEDVLPGLLHPEDDAANTQVQHKLQEHQDYVSHKVEQNGGFDKASSVMFGNFDRFTVKDLQFHNYPWVSRGAIRFLEDNANGERPFFLYLAPTSVHGPHHAKGLANDYALTPEGYLPDVPQYRPDLAKIQSRIKEMSSPQSHRYVGMAMLDHQIGLVLEKLDELGIADNTIVIFLPDHNTEPAKATCYEKGLRIPMMIRGGKRYPNRLISRDIRTLDLFPTILEMADVALPEHVPLDGQSLVPLLKGDLERRMDSIPIFAEAGYTRSVKKGRFKYIAFRYPRHIEEKIMNGELAYAPNYLDQVQEGLAIISEKKYPSYYHQDQLFDLVQDPYEQNNLAYDPQYTERLGEMKQLLSEHLGSFSHPFDLKPSAVMESKEYKRLVAETRKMEVEHMDWFKRDWGKIVWPPK